MKTRGSIVVFLLILLRSAFSQTPCDLTNYQTAFRIPPTSFPYFSVGAGITVSVVTNVVNYANFTYNCNALPYAGANPAWGLTAATHYIRLTFSAPVTNLTVLINGTNQTEEFYHAAGTGAITLQNYCTTDFIATASTLTDMAVPANGSIITLTNTTGSTTYTLTHNGLGAGSRVTLLDCIVALVPLPVELSTFNAVCTNKDEASLSWKVIGGRALGKLEIEKSFDGENWTVINAYSEDEMRAEGDYSYVDRSNDNTLRYYRLKQTSAEGYYKFSETILAGNCHKKKSELYVFPNPTKGIVSLEGYMMREVQLLDATGNEILTAVSEDGHKAMLNLSSLEKGIYFIRSGEQFKKIIKE